MIRRWRAALFGAAVAAGAAGAVVDGRSSSADNRPAHRTRAGSRSTGWVTTFDPGNVQDDLYRTTDGGIHWKLQLRSEHGDHAGAQGFVQLLDARRGWVAMLDPNAPGGTYWHTGDGGKRWIQDRRSTGPPAGTLAGARAPLPVPGDPRESMVSGPLVSIASLRTWWVADTVGAGQRATTRIRTTTDAGRHWTSTVSDLAPAPVDLKAAGFRDAWAKIAVPDGRTGSVTELEQTTDGGARWRRAR
jgi:hypothetical protein